MNEPNLEKLLRLDNKLRREPEFAGLVGETVIYIKRILKELEMARTFVAAAAVLVQDDQTKTTQLAAANTALTAANAQIATLQQNQQTPDVMAAQQTIIDQAESVSPSDPTPPPATT